MSLAPPLVASPVAPGYRLDRYELLCAVAEGGMASIWVARMRGKHGFEKLVAIKMILQKFAQDPRFERMFLDEAGIAARIEHANVAQILDLGEVHGVLYLAMEWVDGDSLSKLARAVHKKGMAIPPGVALRVLADVSGGLHTAHELKGKGGDPMGVVHRDVTPQNVLVSMSGVAKLIDFGIAKARDRVADDTHSGTLKGKIHFMAPEQALAQQVDRRADIWAVGATLYHLLTGKPPYEGDNHIATLHLLVSGKPPPPLPSTVHPAIRAIIARTLARDPAQRFQTAEEMQGAMESAMVEARLVTTTTHVATFVREHMAERSARRKEAIDLALSAAAERARVGDLLERPGMGSASGVGDVSAVRQNALTIPAGPAGPAGPMAQGSGPHEGSAPQSMRSEGFSATLGSASLEAAPMSLPTRRPWGVIFAGLALVAAGAVLFVLSGVGRHAPPPVPAASTPATVTADSTPSGPAPVPPPTAGWDLTPAPSGSSSASASSPPLKIYRPPPRPPPAPSSSTTPRRRRVDDGF